MKSRLTTSQKVFHPVLFGLTRGFDEIRKAHHIHDVSNNNCSPDQAGQPDSQNGNTRPNHPIREPDTYPSENRQFPNVKKKHTENDYQKDRGRNKPSTCFSNCSKTIEHSLEEHLICGYEQNGKKINQLVLGLESCNGAIRYTGHILLQDHPIDAFIISHAPKTKNHPFSTDAFMSDNLVIWIKPGLICIVQCSERNECGLLMAAVYRGLKNSHSFQNRFVGNSTGFLFH